MDMPKQVSEQQLEEIVRHVLADLRATPEPRRRVSNHGGPGGSGAGRDGIFPDIDSAVAAARQGYAEFEQTPLDLRKRVIEGIRAEMQRSAAQLAEMACAETGLGNVSCKTNKNLLAANKTPGVEIMQPVAITGDHGLTLIERAPFGVIASITPTTNPTATITNNVISMLAAGNAVVFNAHPRSKGVSVETIRRSNQAIRAAGGPENLITAIAEPTIESAQYLMHHPDIDLLLVTGGPAVVDVALQTGRRAICAGPGNPPVVVDETADIEKAGRDIVDGCSFDNNLPCTCEKEVFVAASVADDLKAAMRRAGAYEISGQQIKQLENVIFSELGQPWKPGTINPEFIGQSPQRILGHMGVAVDSHIKAVIVEVSADHPLIWTEQMMPVLPITRVDDVEAGIDLAKRAEHGFHHTAIMHSNSLDNLSRMAREINTTLFVKNGPSYAGLGYEGEGYTGFSFGTRTGEGLTTARTFSWERRCVLVDHFRIV
jgi:aldehyde dehydrogenase